MDDSKIFDNVYPDLLSQLKSIDISQKMEILGIQKRGQLFVFDFFNEQILFDGNDFFTAAGKDFTPAVKVVFCKYILMCPEQKLKSSGKLITFREFTAAGPLFSRFTENTGKIIQTSFAGQIERLSSQCDKLGGTVMDNPSYDICVRFRALPNIPIILNFNDSDELMPAAAGFLYQETADTYLDLQGLGITCTYLTGCLIQNA